ncbi:MAG: dTDP-4-dehydrorhamnose reductase [Spirochaetia bacterium]|nr:dTDP-4-dehydrorhamnose reductase [Spirochaetia bacterium]
MAEPSFRIAVIGGGGQLGTSLRELAANGAFSHSFVFAERSKVDLTRPETFELFLNENPSDILINAAAYTAVDQAEKESETANQVNSKGVGILSNLCARKNIFLVHISTDYVFDGRKSAPYNEDDVANPINVYGKSKWEGEEAVRRSGVKGLILRTAWLHSPHGKNFVKTILRLARERGELRVVNDQFGTPTSAHSLALAVLRALPILKEKVSAVETFHLTDEGSASWYDFAAEIIGLSGIPAKVHPIPTSDYPTPAPRPANTVLSKKKWKSWTGQALPDWKEELAYVKDLTR